MLALPEDGVERRALRWIEDGGEVAGELACAAQGGSRPSNQVRQSSKRSA